MALTRRSSEFPPSPSMSSRSGASTPLGYKDLGVKIAERIQSGDPFYSLEFFPPRTLNAAGYLIDKIERMAAGNPLFCDVTWHPGSGGRSAGGEGHSMTQAPGSMSIAKAMLNQCGIETLLHLTCCNQSQGDIHSFLLRAKECGIKNILALRGDPPDGKKWTNKPGGFAYATDLVKYIRNTFGDFFVIGVAGYPSQHPESESREEDLKYLKAKVDAGADFIISQLFFRADTFLQFVSDCRKIGIDCPIIPGIMPIQGYKSLMHIVKLSQLEVPKNIVDVIESIKDNDESVRQFGIQLATDMCRELLNDRSRVPGLHFYTLNREKACTVILESLGLITNHFPRCLPWKKTANYTRASEEVRPIFWALRPRSYVARTSDWDEFPNGRWGNSSAPAFGDIMDHHLFFLKGCSSRDDQLKLWGQSPASEQEVWDIFHCYISGARNSQGHPVTHIPWHDGQLDTETCQLIPHLSKLNKHGYLTINSQPNINGVSSSDPVIGWGNKGGYIYQKAYLEFFMPPERTAVLLKVLKEKYANRVNYHIVNFQGDSYTNSDSLQPIAVTWGVFPGKEIIQPTVVDPISFNIWKDEAFAIWMDTWGHLYDEGSSSWKLLESIQKSYFLVNLVDNEFPKENVLWEVVEEVSRRSGLLTADVSSAHIANLSSSSIGRGPVSPKITPKDNVQIVPVGVSLSHGDPGTVKREMKTIAKENDRIVKESELVVKGSELVVKEGELVVKESESVKDQDESHTAAITNGKAGDSDSFYKPVVPSKREGRPAAEDNQAKYVKVDHSPSAT